MTYRAPPKSDCVEVFPSHGCRPGYDGIVVESVYVHREGADRTRAVLSPDEARILVRSLNAAITLYEKWEAEGKNAEVMVSRAGGQ